MNFGMPSLLETPTLRESSALCASLGLDFVELNMNMPEFQIGSLSRKALEAASREFGIYYTIHLDENLNISDFNPLVTSAYTETLLQAAELGVPVLNMHMQRGVYFTMPSEKIFLYDIYRQQYLEMLASFRERAGALLSHSGTMLCIENTNGYTDFMREGIDYLLGSDNIRLTFDVGHNHGTDGADESFIMSRKDKLSHIHLHDAKGKNAHLPLGEGELDIGRYLRVADECSARVVLETKTVEGLKKSVSKLKSYTHKGVNL